MSERKSRTVLTAAVLLAVVLAAAVVLSLSRSRPPAAGRTLKDLAGREVAVPDTVERLIALGPGALRLVAYLGAADRVVGMEDMENRMSRELYSRPYGNTLSDDYYDLPVVSNGGPGALPDPERLLLCKPDLIVAVTIDAAQLDVIQAKTGVPTLYLSYGELGVWREEARRSLSLLGDALGRRERADALNAYIASLEQDLKKRTEGIAEEDKPSAYFGGISYKGSHGLTSTEGGYPPARMASARNLADEVGKSGHFFVDKEQILTWNPDFIFVDTGSREILDLDFEKNRGFYRLLKAPGAGRAFSLLPYNYYNTNIELALLNAYFVGKSVYPDRFKDVVIEDKAREIMERFLGIRPDEEIPAFKTLRFPATGPLEWK